MEKQQNWIIPYKKYELPKSEIVHYWMIELPLKSGEVQQFYIKARDKFDALKKAKEFQFLVDLPKLRKSNLVLRH